MPLASQYLLLVCIMCQPRLKCSLGSLARLSTLSLFIEDTRYLSLCCARYILLSIGPTLNPNTMIKIAPEL